MREYREIVKRLEKGSLYLFTAISGQKLGEKAVLQGEELLCLEESTEDFWSAAVREADLDSCPYRYESEKATIFVERLSSEPELVICGGGHVSLKLAALADFMGYPYTVIEDRKEFVGRDRFPNAGRLILSPFGRALVENAFSYNAYYVIVTRGHAADLECLRLILLRPSGYVGMIGSAKKVARTMEILRTEGYAQERLGEVHAPIGLKIGGQTPKEIAVSIIAQLIQVKNSESAFSCLAAGLRNSLLSDTKIAVLRIVGKRGSAPRGVGSWMTVDEDGNLCGTIGGGVIEYMAVEEAKKLLDTGGSRLVSYHLDTDRAGETGMWCGGDVDVMIEA